MEESWEGWMEQSFASFAHPYIQRLSVYTARSVVVISGKAVISDLALAKCADSRVGTEFFRGISGGKPVRESIKMRCFHKL